MKICFILTINIGRVIYAERNVKPQTLRIHEGKKKKAEIKSLLKMDKLVNKWRAFNRRIQTTGEQENLWFVGSDQCLYSFFFITLLLRGFVIKYIYIASVN